jgi:hypothetical protein
VRVEKNINIRDLRVYVKDVKARAAAAVAYSYSTVSFCVLCTSEMFIFVNVFCKRQSRC